MAVTLRPATPADRPALEIIRRQAIEAEYSDTYDRSRYADLVATPDTTLQQWLTTDRYVALLLETEVTPTAYGVLDADEGRVVALYTAPSYMREGHATRLLDAMEARCDHPVLTVTAPPPIVDFFRERGFDTPGEQTGDKLPRISLRKDLDR